MAARTRKLEIQITGDAKDAEKAFDRVGKAAQDSAKEIDKVGDSDPFGKLQGKVDDGADGFASKFEGLGDAAGGLFAGAFAAAGVAGVGLLTEAFGNALDAEFDIDKVVAQLGVSGKFAEDIGDVAGQLYGEAFTDSVGEAAGAIKSVIQSGLLPMDFTKDSLHDLTAMALTFSDVLDEDLGGSVNAVVQMLRTGLAKNAEEAFDILTRGIQLGGDKAGDLLDTFNEYSTQFRKLGLSGADAMGLMVQGIQGGARDADIVADALKEFSIRAVDGSELTKNAFEALGLSGDEMTRVFAEGGPPAAAGLDLVLTKLAAVEDPAMRSQLAVALFGTQAEDMGLALGALDPSNAVATLGAVEGSTDNLSSAYDNAKSTLDVFWHQALEKVTMYIATTVIPWIEAHKGSIEGAIQTMGHWAQAIGGVLSWLGAMIDKVRIAIGWIGDLADKISALPMVGNILEGGGLAREGHILEDSMGSKVGKTVPHLADGGVITRPTFLLAGEAGPEAIVPLGRGGMGGDTYNFHFNGAVLDGRKLISAINDAMAGGHRLQAQGRGL